MLIAVNSFLFLFSIAGILIAFLFNPLLVRIISLTRGRNPVKTSPIHPAISHIIIVRNAMDIITEKLTNANSIQYPSDNYEIIIFSDGSTDETETRVKPFLNEKNKFFSFNSHEGKNIAINKAFQICSGEIIVFSDADSIMESSAVMHLIKYFSDPEIGGVCGQRIIYEDGIRMTKAQSDYIRFDSMIKKMESQIGSVSANEGKIYAIRRNLFQPIPQAVTDDLYVCLAVVKQGYRFIFEPDAKVFIKTPSRSPKHEIERRRRIVSTSLRCIYQMRELLSPLKYGYFSFLLLNRNVARRFLPVFLFLIFFSNLFLSFYIPIMTWIFFLQMFFYIFAISYWGFFQHVSKPKIIVRATSLVFYFCIGNYGTLRGLLDFLTRKQIFKWEPQKTG